MNRFQNKPIVVPWDFQDMALEALEVALEIAESSELVELVHVTEYPKGVRPSIAIEGFSEKAEQEKFRKKYQEQVSDDLQELNFTLLFDFDSDHGSEIAKFAKSKNAGLVVISSHGRKGIVRLILGSVAEKWFGIAIVQSSWSATDIPHR